MSVANHSFEQQNQAWAATSAGLSASVIPIAKDFEGQIVLGYTTITAVATLTALTTPKFAHGCQVYCISSNAATTVRIMFNSGTPAAPTFTGLIS